MRHIAAKEAERIGEDVERLPRGNRLGIGAEHAFTLHRPRKAWYTDHATQGTSCKLTWQTPMLVLPSYLVEAKQAWSLAFRLEVD